MEHNNFENKIKQVFDKFEATPPEQVLGRIKQTARDKQVSPTKRNKFTKTAAWVTGGAIVLSLAILGIRQNSRITESTVNHTSKDVVTQNETPKDNSQTKTITENINSSPKADIKENPKNIASRNIILMADAGEDKTICGLVTTLETRLSAKGAQGYWKYAGNDNRNVILESSATSGAIVRVEESGMYNFLWTEELSGQVSSDQVQVNFIEVSDVSAGKNMQVCGLETELKSNGFSGSWSTLSNGNIKEPLNPVSKVFASEFGAHHFIWTEKSGHCKTSDTVRIDFLNSPNAEIIIAKSPQCFGEVFEVRTTEQEGCNYSWDFTGAHVEKISGQSFKVKYNLGGNYKINVEVARATCSASDKIAVNYPEKLEAKFMVSDPGIELPALVYFTNLSSIGGESYDMFKDIEFLWNFGNGQTSKLENPECLYDIEGIFTPTLEITTAAGCRSTYTGPDLVISRQVETSTTKVITPNGDGENDVFKIDASLYKSFTCIVYSPNGKRLHSWSNPDGAWDAYLKDGSLATTGTYFYIVKAVGINGRPIEFSGAIYLFR